MMKRRNRFRAGLIWATALLLLLLGSSAQAVTRDMVGSWGVINPSVAPPGFFRAGPNVLGKKVGPYVPDTGWKTVEVLGTTPTTFVGRQLTVPAGKFDFSGFQFRNFPAFPVVANATRKYTTTQPNTETFMIGGGALAQCPGNGCTFSSYTTTTGGVTNTITVPGTAISWCPPPNNANPAPGTPNSQIGDWNCPSQQGAGVGALNVRLGISNAPGANRFGGTLEMLKNGGNDAWYVLVQPGTDGIGEAVRNFWAFDQVPWEHGANNFSYGPLIGNAGPRINVRLDASGAVAETLGCVNGVGTVGEGATFVLGAGPFLKVGSNCGTGASIVPSPQWGFRLTTGDVEGSDPWPFISVTDALPPGTAFAPNVKTRTPGQGFFFTRMGTDRVTGTTRRNIVLIGGGVLFDPGSGNLAFNVVDLRFDLSVPEPAMGLALVAGAAALVALARRQRG